MRKEVKFRRIGSMLFRWLSTANYNETIVRHLTFDLNNVLFFAKLVMDNIFRSQMFRIKTSNIEPYGQFKLIDICLPSSYTRQPQKG